MADGLAVSFPLVMALCISIGVVFALGVLAMGLYAWDGVVAIVSRLRSRKKVQPSD